MTAVDLRQYLKRPAAMAIDLVPVVNVMALVFFYYMIAPVFLKPAPLDVRLPRALTSDAVREDDLTILVTGENVLFLNDKVLTLQALRALLLQPVNRGRPLLLKVDRRASMGRIVAVLDMGRSLGVERINVVTDQEE